jgi:hypothetical protein
MGRWNHGLKVNCGKDTASAVPPPRMEKTWGFSPYSVPEGHSFSPAAEDGEDLGL